MTGGGQERHGREAAGPPIGETTLFTGAWAGRDVN